MICDDRPPTLVDHPAGLQTATDGVTIDPAFLTRPLEPDHDLPLVPIGWTT